MKRIAALALLLLAGCATDSNYIGRASDSTSSELIAANHGAADKLVTTALVPIDRAVPLLVATVVNIDSLNQSSRFGRLVSEQVASRLAQVGFNVVEMKLRTNVYIQEGTGELLLSRDVRDLSKTYNAQVVAVGNYAVASNHVYLTLKLITVTDNRVVSAVNYVLPLTGNNRALLLGSGPSRPY